MNKSFQKKFIFDILPISIFLIPLAISAFIGWVVVYPFIPPQTTRNIEVATLATGGFSGFEILLSPSKKYFIYHDESNKSNPDNFSVLLDLENERKEIINLENLQREKSILLASLSTPLSVSRYFYSRRDQDRTVFNEGPGWPDNLVLQ
jgi:hypothetical protein